jgi:hypothetical protein
LCGHSSSRTEENTWSELLTEVQLNKNVVNDSEPLLRLIGDLPAGTPVAFEAAFGIRPGLSPAVMILARRIAHR